MARLHAEEQTKRASTQRAHSRYRNWLPAAALISAAALIAILVASLLAARANDAARRDIFDDLEPFDAALGQLDVSVLTMSSQARGYALTGDPLLRVRYEDLRIAFESERLQLRTLAAPAGFDSQSQQIDELASQYILVTDRIVSARDGGNEDEARRIVLEEAPGRLDEYSAASFRLQTSVDVRKTSLADRARALERREIIVLFLAGGAGLAASLVLVWLARRNIRLAAQIDDQRQRLDDVVSNVPGVVWETRGGPHDQGQRLEFVSHHAEAMLGYPMEQWFSAPDFWLSIIHPDDRERTAAEMREIFRSGSSGQCQFRWIALDGHMIDVLSYVSVMLDGEGNPAGMRGVIIDITDRRRAEERLRISAESGRTLFASLNYEMTLSALADLCVPYLADWCAVHLAEEGGGFRAVAAAHADPAKVETVRDLLRRYSPPPDAPRGVSHVMGTGQPELVSDITEEMLVRYAVGEEHLRLLRELRIKSYICVPLVVHERVFGALTLVYAESGRRYTDDELALAQDLALRAAISVENAQLYGDAERERARFSSIVASVSLGVYQLDDRGRIIYLNPAAPALLQMDQAALQGRDPHDAIRHRLLDGSPCAARTCPLKRTVTDTVPHTGMVSLLLRGRSSRELEVTISPIVVRAAPSGAVVVFQDVTERLLQARMRDDFLAFASHELRSPLTTLSGFAKWLEKRTKTLTGVLDPESMEAIQTISKEADRMVNIVELFLDLTRIESNRLTLALAPVDFRAIVLGEVEAAAARHREIRIARELRDEPLSGVSDVNRLRQVLTNLLENAAVYGAGYADPDVRVRLARVEEGVRVSVWNAGPGIAPEDQPHIFERFYRGRIGDARKVGIGIGLFISRQIAERLGGTLTFESSPEQGTEFVLSLPLHPGNGRSAHRTGDGDGGFAER